MQRPLRGAYDGIGRAVYVRRVRQLPTGRPLALVARLFNAAVALGGDPYAKARFSSRQRRLAQVMRAKVVYTPQVLLQGEDFRRWHTAAFDEAVARINARPGRARIELVLEKASAGLFPVEARVEVLEPAQRADAGLYLAAYENKLVSAVGAGENRGKT